MTNLTRGEAFGSEHPSIIEQVMAETEDACYAVGKMVALINRGIAASPDDQAELYETGRNLMMKSLAQMPNRPVTTNDGLDFIALDGVTDVDQATELVRDTADLHLGRPGECGPTCPANFPMWTDAS